MFRRSAINQLLAFLLISIGAVHHVAADTYYACVLTCLDGTRMTPLGLDGSPATQCHGDPNACSNGGYLAFLPDQLETCAAQAPASVTGSARYSDTYLHADAYPFADSAACVAFQSTLSQPASDSTSNRRLLAAENDAQVAHCGCKDMMNFTLGELASQVLPWGTSGDFCDQIVKKAVNKLDDSYCSDKFKTKSNKNLFPFADELCNHLVDPVTGAIGDAFKPVCEAVVQLISTETGVDINQQFNSAQRDSNKLLALLLTFVDKACGPLSCSSGNAGSGCNAVESAVTGSVAKILTLGSTAYCDFASISSSPSTPSSSGSGSDSNGCFPGSAVVTTPHGKAAMGSLQLGDMVLAASTTGKLQFEHVFAFTDNDRKVQGHFIDVAVQTKAGIQHLQVTGQHFVVAQHAAQKLEPIFSASSIITAAELRVGDLVWIALDAEDGAVSPASIAAIYHSTAQGHYSPQVPSGTIVVNGIVAATYTTAVRNRFLWQVAMAFLRGWRMLQHAQVQAVQFLVAGSASQV